MPIDEYLREMEQVCGRDMYTGNKRGCFPVFMV